MKGIITQKNSSPLCLELGSFNTFISTPFRTLIQSNKLLLFNLFILEIATHQLCYNLICSFYALFCNKIQSSIN